MKGGVEADQNKLKIHTVRNGPVEDVTKDLIVVWEKMLNY